MRTTVIALMMTLLGLPAFGQESPPVGKADRNGGEFRFTLESIALPDADPVGFCDPRNPVPNNWDINIRNLQGDDALVNPTSQEYKDQMDELSRIKVQNRAAMGEMPDDDGAQNRSSSLPIQPKIDEEWQCTYSAGASNVPDGAAAVSYNGYIVTTNNTHVEFFDEEGTVLYSQGEDTFWAAAGPTANIYDPRVMYNASQNKFMMVALHGSTSSLTEVLVAFSVSSNPNDGWWIYVFDGNPGGLSSWWFDYPSTGYSSEDLFISGNMFNNSDAFQQTTVRQMEMLDGFIGGTVSSVYWEDVNQGTGGNAFTCVPVSYPFSGYGPGAYMVSADGGNSDINYYDIDADINDPGNPTLSSFNISVPSWTNAANAPQLGSTKLLGTGGDRIRSAYYGGGGEIHLAQTVAWNGSNDAGLRYTLLDVGAGTSSTKNFGLDGFDYAYPWIQPWAQNSGTWDGGSMVAFLRSSSTIYPQFRVVHIDGNLDFGGSVLVQAGSSPISASSGTNRWGDYLGGGFRESQNQPECWIYGQFGQNNDHAMWVAEVVLAIQGCTDPVACNYDPQAEENDGSCDYTTCSGCTNVSACNYDSSATIDDGSCTYPGCTDFWACNYSSSAGCNDGSCCYDYCIVMETSPFIFDPFGGNQNTMNFTITDNATGNVVESGNNGLFAFTYNFCMPAGCYTLDVTVNGTSYWDLWRDYVFIIIGVDYTIYEGTTSFSGEFIIGDGGSTAGCTDPFACNYDADAICDNNSCCYENCLIIDQTDSFGDGWNNNDWEVVEPDTDVVVASGTLESGSSGQDIACLEDGCYIFRINTSEGQYSSEVGWTISGIDGTPISGGASDETYFTIGGGGADYACTDPLACNYSPEAICDDDSCCYDWCGNVNMTDGFGDGWNGGTMTISQDGVTLYTITLATGVSGSEEICLTDGCYLVEVTGGSFPSEINWTILFSNTNQILGGGAPYSEYLTVNGVYGCTALSACNYNPGATCDDGSCTYPGCTDAGACNYDPFAGCAAICDYGCIGCTYPLAINYNPGTTVDDGSCIFDCDDACPQDMDGDGFIGSADLLDLLGSFGTFCP